MPSDVIRGYRWASYFQLRDLPSAIQATAVSSRRRRVSSDFASVTQVTYSRRCDGLKAVNAASAFLFWRTAAVKYAGGLTVGLGGTFRRETVTPSSLSV